MLHKPNVANLIWWIVEHKAKQKVSRFGHKTKIVIILPVTTVPIIPLATNGCSNSAGHESRFLGFLVSKPCKKSLNSVLICLGQRTGSLIIRLTSWKILFV